MRMGGDCMTRQRFAVRIEVRIAGTDDTTARRLAVHMVVRARE